MDIVFFLELFNFLYLLPALALAIWARRRIARARVEVARWPAPGAMTGAEAAAAVLRATGSGDVTVVRVEGPLADLYDPRLRRVRLSGDVFDGRSLAAVGVALHEAGHAVREDGVGARRLASLPRSYRLAFAILDRLGTAVGRLRPTIAAAVRLGATAAWLTMLAGLVLPMPMLFLPGIALYSAAAALPLATLPIGRAASRRARRAFRRARRSGDGFAPLGGETGPALARYLDALAWADVAATLTVLPDWFLGVVGAGRSGRRPRVRGS